MTCHQSLYVQGATNGTVLYDPNETWSLATVITLCGIHSALPVASSQPQPGHQTRLHQWLHSAATAVQHHIHSWLQRSPEDAHANKSLYTTPLDLGHAIFDTRGMWANDVQATSWAFDHLFFRCRQTSEMVAIQVSIGSKLFMGTQHIFQVICMLTA